MSEHRRLNWVYCYLHQTNGPPLCTYLHCCILYTVCLCMRRAYFSFMQSSFYYAGFISISLCLCQYCCRCHYAHTYHIHTYNLCIVLSRMLRCFIVCVTLGHCADRRLYNVYLRSLLCISLAVDLSVLIACYNENLRWMNECYQGGLWTWKDEK